MAKKVHPNTLANLTYHEGRKPLFGTKKKGRRLSVTEEGWEGTAQVAQALGCRSVSDFLEKIGRGEVKVV